MEQKIVIVRRLFQPTACPDFRGSNLTTIASIKRFKIASCLAMKTFFGSAVPESVNGSLSKD